MKKIIPVLFVSMLSLVSSSVMAGVQMEATRVIYNFDDKEASLSIKNTAATDTYLVQSWVESDSGVRPPFTIVPPLFRCGGNEEHALRIIKTGDNLPKDRESQFWLDVKAIPSVDDKNTKNSLQLIVKSRLKLFYRPKSLDGDPEEAYKKITFSVNGKELKVTNPTPFYVSFYSLKFNGEEVEDAKMVPPRNALLLKVPENKKSTKIITWQAIQDSGEKTQTQEKSL
ncbi:molecular chaperone [Rahnella inusitata]|uniref:fimbrial biogenesis chaperone n=1 Tax=Rahnella inusitata TaxID=58169 RepID=UPI0039AF721B